MRQLGPERLRALLAQSGPGSMVTAPGAYDGRLLLGSGVVVSGPWRGAEIGWCEGGSGSS